MVMAVALGFPVTTQHPLHYLQAQLDQWFSVDFDLWFQDNCHELFDEFEDLWPPNLPKWDPDWPCPTFVSFWMAYCASQFADDPAGQTQCNETRLDLGFEGDERLMQALDVMARYATGEGVSPAGEKRGALRYY